VSRGLRARCFAARFADWTLRRVADGLIRFERRLLQHFKTLAEAGAERVLVHLAHAADNAFRANHQLADTLVNRPLFAGLQLMIVHIVSRPPLKRRARFEV
jgi:hypothetical protein